MQGIQALGKWEARPGTLTEGNAYFPIVILCPVGTLSQVNAVFPRTSLCCMGALTATKAYTSSAIRSL